MSSSSTTLCTSARGRSCHLGHDVGKLRRSAPLAFEAGDALVDAQAQLDEITARRTGLFQHDGKERVPGMGHGMLRERAPTI